MTTDLFYKNKKYYQMKKTETKSSIEFDKKQYETLVRALQIAGSIYSILGDMVDEKYIKQADAMDDLESWILGKAGEFGMADIVEIFETKNVLKDDATDKYIDHLVEYEEWAFWDVFAHKLADRDMAQRYEKGELPPKLKGHELMHLHFELEEKYEKEFEKHGLDRFEIREDKKD
jgi:hypothetical protein